MQHAAHTWHRHRAMSVSADGRLISHCACRAWSVPAACRVCRIFRCMRMGPSVARCALSGRDSIVACCVLCAHGRRCLLHLHFSMLHDVLCMLHVARFDRCQVSMFVLLTGSFPFDGDDEDTVRLLQPTNKQASEWTPYAAALLWVRRCATGLRRATSKQRWRALSGRRSPTRPKISCVVQYGLVFCVNRRHTRRRLRCGARSGAQYAARHLHRSPRSSLRCRRGCVGCCGRAQQMTRCNAG